MLQSYGGETYLFEFDDTLWEFYVEEISTGKRYRFDLKSSDIDALHCISLELPSFEIESGEEDWEVEE